MKTVTKYVTNDGEEFDSLAEAEEHEAISSSSFLKWKTSYNGAKAFEKYDLDEYGTWRVLGEDPNCDLGGNHVNPFLGLFEGNFEEVVKEAVELSGFWTWGAGGQIIKEEVTRV